MALIEKLALGDKSSWAGFSSPFNRGWGCFMLSQAPTGAAFLGVSSALTAADAATCSATASRDCRWENGDG